MRGAIFLICPSFSSLEICLLNALSLEEKIISCKWMGLFLSIIVAFNTQIYRIFSILIYFLENIFYYNLLRSFFHYTVKAIPSWRMFSVKRHILMNFFNNQLSNAVI